MQKWLNKEHFGHIIVKNIYVDISEKNGCGWDNIQTIMVTYEFYFWFLKLPSETEQYT